MLRAIRLDASPEAIGGTEFVQTSVTQMPVGARLEALLGHGIRNVPGGRDVDRFHSGLAFTLAHWTSVCAGSVTGRLHRAPWTEDLTTLCGDPSLPTMLMVA